MKELVGKCDICKQDVYCLDGFFTGIVKEEKIICFKCNEDEQDN